jgi:7-cyano-7-deazaguanine synthase in queuosine biosynthesis
MNIQIVASTERRDDGLLGLAISQDGQPADRRLDIDFRDLGRALGTPRAKAMDLLLIASSCYAADKLVDRRDAADRWTRQMDLTVPVSDPAAWNHVAASLEDALCFLSGDLWTLSFVPLERALYLPPNHPARHQEDEGGQTWGASCLFSGGLDSLAGVLDLLNAEGVSRVLLVSHYDAPTGEQARLLPYMAEKYGNRIENVRARIRTAPVRTPENTLRTRSLVFLALGILGANAAGDEVPLYAYENGHIALNVPLTPSRAGACSTRTMHPFFIEAFAGALREAGLHNPILRPYELKTKGECVAGCSDGATLRELSGISVSCSHPSRRRYWERRIDIHNCGYCVPCLIRRAAMHKAGWDDGRKYGIDVCKGEIEVASERDSSDDLRAMLDIVRQAPGAAAIARSINQVAPVADIRDRADVVLRGLNEIRSLVRDKGVGSIREAAGV